MKTFVMLEIIDVLGKYSKMSKIEIAEALGISYATVAKYLNVLSERGLVQSSYSIAKIKQRRSVRFSLNHKKYIAVFKFSSDSIELFLISLRGTIKEKFSFKFDFDSDPERIVMNFKDGASYYLNKHGMVNCVCSIVILPDGEDRLSSTVVQNIKDFLYRLPIANTVECDDILRLQTKYIIKSLKDTDIALVLFLDKKKYLSCIATDKTDSENISFSNFGETLKINVVPFKEYSELMNDPASVIKVLTEFIDNTTSIVPVTKVFICGEAYRNMSALTKLISEAVEKKEIIINNVSSDEVIADVAVECRNSHIDNIISSCLYK